MSNETSVGATIHEFFVMYAHTMFSVSFCKSHWDAAKSILEVRMIDHYRYLYALTLSVVFLLRIQGNSLQLRS